MALLSQWSMCIFVRTNIGYLIIYRIIFELVVIQNSDGSNGRESDAIFGR